MHRQYFTYIMTNKYNNVLYTGVTRDLKRRVYEHKDGVVEGFTRRYTVKKLVYFEEYKEITDAIAREKQIKGGSRKKKIELINGFNKEWRDLSDEL